MNHAFYRVILLLVYNINYYSYGDRSSQTQNEYLKKYLVWEGIISSQKQVEVT